MGDQHKFQLQVAKTWETMTRILALRGWPDIPTIDLMHVWPDVHIMKFGIILRSAIRRKGREKKQDKICGCNGEMAFTIPV